MSVVVKETKIVYPASQHHNRTWEFSMNDFVMPPVNIRWVSIYETNGSNDFMSAEQLESSLAKALDLYPLLAGRLVDLPLGKMHVEYNQADLKGVSLVLATSELSLAKLKNANYAREQIPAETMPGTPFPSPGGHLFEAQITRLSCGSVIMGYSLHHRVGDGYSVHNFVNNWAKLCRGEKVDPPLLDRAALSPNSASLVSEHPEYIVVEPSPTAAPAPPPLMPESKRLVLTFLPEKIALLKKTANESIKNGRWVSTNDALVAVIWRVLSRARGLKEGTETTCGLAVDGRKKWNTSLGDMAHYFGNFIAFLNAKTDAGKLLNASLGDAALIIRDHVEKMNQDFLQSSLNWIDRVPDKSKIQGNFKMYQGHDIFNSSWLTFPMYDCDFKWGMPVRIVLHAPGSDGITLNLPLGPANEVEKYGMEVIVGVLAPNVDKVFQDEELKQFATVVID